MGLQKHLHEFQTEAAIRKDHLIFIFLYGMVLAKK